jgi:hypothetical protein
MSKKAVSKLLICLEESEVVEQGREEQRKEVPNKLN